MPIKDRLIIFFLEVIWKIVEFMSLKRSIFLFILSLGLFFTPLYPISYIIVFVFIGIPLATYCIFLIGLGNAMK